MNHDHPHGMGKHMLLMLVCCLVPLALVVLVGTFGLSLGPLQGLVPYVAALMCPLMMVFMMRMMMQGQVGEHDPHPAHSHESDALRTPSTKQVPETATGALNTIVAASPKKCH